MLIYLNLSSIHLYRAFLLSGCTLHRHVNCRKPLFSVCVPTPDINYHRNIKVVFEVLISDFFTLRSEHEMLRKVPKIKDFYEVFFCINTIVSTCPSLSQLRELTSSPSYETGNLKSIRFKICPLGCSSG